MQMTKLCRLMVVLSLLSSWAAQAVPITYNFGGTVTSSFLPAQFAVGSSFNGSFTFDSAAVDADPNATVGDYATGFGITATVGGITYSNVAGSGSAIVWNNNGGLDRFDAQVQGVLAGPVLVNASTNLAGFSPFILRAVFDDSSQTAFSSDSLPALLNPGAFGSDVFQLSFYQGVTQVNVLGTIDSLRLAGNGTGVPEPATYALMLFGLGAFAMQRRRRKL